MRARAAVGYRFWQRVAFVPNDVLAEKPAIVLQGQRQPPRDTHQVFRWQIAAACATGSVAVAEIEPKGTVVGQKFAHQTEYL